MNKMKNGFGLLLLCLTLLFSLTTGQAQNWETDFEAAKQISEKDGKPLIMVFQGSDWCGPCIEMDKKVWASKDFVKYAKDNLVLLKVDFPRRKKNALSEEQVKMNYALAEKYNKPGVFPFIVVFNSKGNPVAETGYKRMGPKYYINMFDKFVK